MELREICPVIDFDRDDVSKKLADVMDCRERLWSGGDVYTSFQQNLAQTGFILDLKVPHV